MTPDTLTRSYEDLSTDEGFQFRFHCERCDAAYVSRFQPDPPDAMDGPLAPVGGLLGAIGSGEPAGGGRPGFAAALQAAIAEVSERFHECPRCGVLVCDQCWNRALLLCEKCAPSEPADQISTSERSA